MIKAPFNFVPISSKVFFPDDWSGKISNDIPFSDGISGIIELSIKAESPIFVRNGHAKNIEDDSFSKMPDNQFFIPGSSIRGCIRNVLEIMSFGKLTMDDNAMFAQREWNNDELYTLKKQQAKFHCGYLKYDIESDEYCIVDHDKPLRIGHDEIDKYLNNGDKFRKHFCQDSDFDIKSSFKVNGNLSFDPKTAAFKYYLVGDSSRLEHLSFSESNTTTDYSTRLVVDPNGDYKGDIVLTGQPDKWKWPRPVVLDKKAGKFYEFVFLSEEIATYPISQHTFKHFEFIYSESSEWKRAKQLLDTTGIPVFFRLENNEIKDFGLAYLYKLPYDKSPFDAMPDKHRDVNKIDLPEAIFGYTRGKDSLKGRVYFGNALLQGEPDVSNKTLKMILNSPKASYYPIYVQQKNGSKGYVSPYSTYNDSTIAGWKRYHVKPEISYPDASGKDKEKLATSMIPLNGGTFKSKVVFHNLREVELGALLSALTFHNSEGCYHQIGQGKPYGFGKITIEANLSKMTVSKTSFDLMLAFEQCMRDHIGNNWNQSEQIVNLFTMAHEQVSANSKISEYMHMDNDNSKNEFELSKIAHEFLQTYKALVNKTYFPTSLVEAKNTILNQMVEKADSLLRDNMPEKALELYQEATSKGLDCSLEINKCLAKMAEPIINEANNCQNAGDFAEAIKLYEKAEGYGVSCFEQKSLCERKMRESTMSLSEMVTISKDSSIAAIAGRIKKYSGTVTEEDCMWLGEQLKEAYTQMNSKNRKSWGDFKNWKPIIDALQSEEKARSVFNAISSE